MSFKPGDKVWIENQGGAFPAGIYAAVIIGVGSMTWEGLPREWWEVDIEGIDKRSLYSHQAFMRHRDDPPHHQEPRLREVGEWDLCPWHPVRSSKEVV